MPNVQGCPIGVADASIRNATVEFCEKTGLWKSDSVVTDVIAGESRYGFATPTGSRVVECDTALLNSKPLVPMTLQNLNEQMPSWRDLEEAKPRLFFMDSDQTIRLVGVPTEDMSNALFIQVILKPSRDALECPDWLYEDWAEVIAHGALARLHAMAGRPWAKEKLVSYHMRMFRLGMARARSKSIKSRQNISTYIKSVNFGDN